ncbi:Ger(x)C family spore germination protein [Paenibacillus sp. YIM B09110]|uniref:Ger(x)C family spore germination protein n=1 Tax=Paenibacillus sp. YIM B09110 TaxID=3126102 RepID=UPI00301DAB59
MARVCAIVICLSVSATLLSSCWDRIELEQRGFVIGVAIDVADKKKLEEHASGEGVQEFKITFQVVVPAGLKQSDKSGATPSNKAYFNVHVNGRTMQEVLAKLASQLSRLPFLEHLKLIIISEKVAATKLGFANVLDYFLRNNDARRNVSVMIAKGEASRALDIVPQGERTPVFFINNIARNGRELMRIHKDTRIGDVHEYLLKRESFTLQKLTIKNLEASLIGASVMDGKTNSLVGFLNQRETQGLNYLTGDNDRGLIELQVEDNLIVFETERSQVRLTSEGTDKGNLKFKFLVEMEVVIAEAFERQDYLSELTIDKLQVKVEEEVVRLTEETIAKTQKIYKKDVIKLGSYLSENKPRLWSQLSDNWDSGINYFSKSEIKVKADVKIRRIGSVNQTEKRG